MGGQLWVAVGRSVGERLGYGTCQGWGWGQGAKEFGRAALLAHPHARHAPLTPPSLELCHTIITRDAKEVEAGRSDGALMALLLDKAGLFLELCGQPEAHVSSAAATCLVAMVGLGLVGGLTDCVGLKRGSLEVLRLGLDPPYF